MRTLRYCKTILSRLGTYNKDTDSWQGKFPTIKGWTMGLYRPSYHPTKAEVWLKGHQRITQEQSGFPAHFFAWKLQNVPSSFLPIGDEPRPLCYRLTMKRGIVRHILYRDGIYGINLNVPQAREMVLAAIDDLGARFALVDYLLDFNPKTRRFIEAWQKSNEAASIPA